MRHGVLEYKYKRQGTIESSKLPPQGTDVMLKADNRLDGEHYLFRELAQKLSEAPIVYKIYSDGSVYFVAPFGMKYGWILGEVAKIYWLLQRRPTQTLNNYREAV